MDNLVAVGSGPESDLFLTWAGRPVLGLLVGTDLMYPRLILPSLRARDRERSQSFKIATVLVRRKFHPEAESPD